MSAARELIAVLVGGGMDPIDAATLVARAGAEMAAGPSKGALRTRKWRTKTASQTVTGDASVTPAAPPSESVTKRHKPSQSVTCDAEQKSALSFFLPFESSEQEKKKERKKEPKRKNGVTLPDHWQPTESHYREGAELGMDRRAVDAKAQAMRLWAGANSNRAVARKSNWDMAFSGWLGRDATRKPPKLSGWALVHQELGGDDGAGTFDDQPPARFGAG